MLTSEPVRPDLAGRRGFRTQVAVFGARQPLRVWRTAYSAGATARTARDERVHGTVPMGHTTRRFIGIVSEPP